MSDLLPVQRSKAQARRFYDRISGIYDILTASEKALIKDGLDLLGVQPGERALEIGCGTGSGLKLILESTPNPAMVIGLDLSHQMLLKSQQKNSGSELSPQHVQGDAVNLPFPSAAFDALFLSFTLELFQSLTSRLSWANAAVCLHPVGAWGSSPWLVHRAPSQYGSMNLPTGCSRSRSTAGRSPWSTCWDQTALRRSQQKRNATGDFRYTLPSAQNKTVTLTIKGTHHKKCLNFPKLKPSSAGSGTVRGTCPVFVTR